MSTSKFRTRLVVALLVLGGLGGATYFGPKVAQSQNIPAPAQSSAVASLPKTAAAAPKTLPKSLPIQLIIPKLGVNAPVISLGLKSDGTLSTPNSPTQAGWYSASPTPGEMGPSVIVGHVDYVSYGPAVFWRLHELQPGDSFAISRADGITANFKVDSVQQFAQDNFPTQAVYGNINNAGIRLITCGGTWNTQTHHYSDNTVVFGSLTN